MGEIADAMIGGLLCAGCGVYLGGEGGGFPEYCCDCKPPAPKIACPNCGKRVKLAGLTDHSKAKHPAEIVEL